MSFETPKFNGTKWCGALNKLEGRRVMLSYDDAGRKESCAGELQWSKELQVWCVVRDDRDWKDRVEFNTADVSTVHRCKGRTRLLPLIVLDSANVVRLVGVWRAEKVANPDAKKLTGFQIVTDDPEVGRLVIAEIFTKPYPVAVDQNHAALIAAAPELYAAARNAVAALDSSNAAMYISGLSVNELRSAVEKAERLGA